MEGQFTDIRIHLCEKESLKALVSCKVAGMMWLTGIRVVEGVKGKFIAMPSRKDAKGEYQDIFFPAHREVREALQTLVLAAYIKAVEKEGAPA